MSKTVKIPNNMHPYWCVINGVKYGPWPAGSVQTVPDEVAALIGAIDAASPEEDPPETIEEEIARIATQIAEAKIAEATEKYVIDLTSLGILPGVTINLTEEGVITYDEFMAATSSGRDIYIKASDGDNDWYWLLDIRRDDKNQIGTTKAMEWGSDGITLAVVSVWGDDPDIGEAVVYGAMTIGFAPNPYAGGGE